MCERDWHAYYQEPYKGRLVDIPLYRGKSRLLDWPCQRQRPDFQSAELKDDLSTLSGEIAVLDAATAKAKNDNAQAQQAIAGTIANLGDEVGDLKSHEVDSARVARIEQQVGRPDPPPSLDERVTKTEKAIAELTPVPKPPAKPAAHPAVRRVRPARNSVHDLRTSLSAFPG